MFKRKKKQQPITVGETNITMNEFARIVKNVAKSDPEPVQRFYKRGQEILANNSGKDTEKKRIDSIRVQQKIIKRVANQLDFEL